MTQTPQLTVGIVGLGYVGLPLALRFAECGVQVRGYDVGQGLVDDLNAGKSRLAHIPSNKVADAVSAGMKSSTDASILADADAIILCVPTPLGKNQQPDLSYVVSSFKAALEHAKKGALISLESTTYPGTVDEIMLPLIAEKGLTVGEDILVCYSPEREDPGRQTHNTSTVPKLVGGVTQACLNKALEVYGIAIDVLVPVSSPAIAEMAKLLENIYRSVNIGLVNELKILTDKMGIDIYEVIEAASSKPYGFTPFYPGPGIGGHCIPIDPFYLTWKAKEFGIHTRFIELSGEINNAMPLWVVRKVAEALNEHGKALNGANVLVLGAAYKPNVDDMRESPSLEVISLLQQRHAQVSYHDPFIPHLPKTRKYDFELSSQALTEETLKHIDAVVLTTHHDNVDYDLVLEHAKLIIDTRGQLPNDRDTVIRA